MLASDSRDAMSGAHYAPVTGLKPREFAARSLLDAERPGDFIEHRIEFHPGWDHLSDPDRRLAQELIFGVTRWRRTLDWLIQRKSDDRPQRPEILVILRLGLYQLFWLDRVPAHAAVDCSVELARVLGVERQAGFINALLRGYVRQQEVTRRECMNLKRRDPALGWSHPTWLVERWQQRWPESFLALLEWNNTPPPTYARVNTLRVSSAKLLEQWRDEGLIVEPFSRDWIEEGQVFALLSHPPLTTLPSFRNGGFYIQDPSTLLAVRELDPQPEERILDLCSAPGGKTTLIAQYLQNRGRIFAHDNHPERLDLVRENCSRLGVQCVDVQPKPPNAEARFDRVLVDAPCSNTGVLRRRIELRWRLSLEEVTALAEEQLSLLERAAQWVRPGGLLVYSTCSLEPEENAGVIDSFLERHMEFDLERERDLIPPRDGVDGAYVARLISTAPLRAS